MAIDFVRLFYGGSYAADDDSRLDARYGAEHEALVALEAAGFIERRQVDGRGDIVWATTIAGNALAMAKLTPPITRATAERIVSEICARAATVNGSPELLFSVPRLTVFGSYLDPTRDRLGDEDVAVSLTPRTTDTDALHQHARQSGRSFSTFIDELDWPRKEVWNILKNRSRGLSLTNQDPSLFTDSHRDVFVATNLGGREW